MIRRYFAFRVIHSDVSVLVARTALNLSFQRTLANLKEPVERLQNICDMSEDTRFYKNPFGAEHYRPGKVLSLRKESPPEEIQATIIEPLAPFTLSCALKVKVDHPHCGGELTAVLKLYDRRFINLERYQDRHTWNPEKESHYRFHVLTGAVEADIHDQVSWGDFLYRMEDDLNNKDEWYFKPHDDLFTTTCPHDNGSSCRRDAWCTKFKDEKFEAFFQDFCWRNFNREKNAYKALESMQGTHVPRLFDTVVLTASPLEEGCKNSGPCRCLEDDSDMEQYSCWRKEDDGLWDPLNPWLVVPGVLMEYIPDSFPLKELPNRAPRKYWQGIIDQTLEILHEVIPHPIANEDINLGNVLISRPKFPGDDYKSTLIDLGYCCLPSDFHRTKDFIRYKKEQNEGFHINVTLSERLEDEFGFIMDGSHDWKWSEVVKQTSPPKLPSWWIK